MPQARRDRRIHRIIDVWLARRSRVGSSIYGTIVVTAVLVVLSEDKSASTGDLILAMGSTAIVFWLAHSYADLVGERVGDVEPAEWRTPLQLFVDEWPMAESALPPIIALAIFGKVWLGLAVALAELAIWGYVAGRRMGAGTLVAVGSAALNGFLGGLLVLLKVFIH
jgi:hypothetical protein